MEQHQWNERGSDRQEFNAVGKILFCGDPHGQLDHVVQAVEDHRPAAAVLLGDIESPKPLDLVLAPILGRAEVWFIHGNHDTDTEESWRHLTANSLAKRNLHGRVQTIASVRVAGLGGIFRGRVWYPPGEPLFRSFEDYGRRLGFPAVPGQLEPLPSTTALDRQLHRQASTIFPQEYERLLSEKADVLVTHEAPSCHPHGFAAIDELARALDVKVLFHGHDHDSLDYSAAWPALGFRAHGVGLREIAQLVVGGSDAHESVSRRDGDE